jgi:hypothetical protein
MMSETTEHDIINYLKGRINAHQGEITKLENIITSFNHLGAQGAYPIREERIPNEPNPGEVPIYPGYESAASIAEKIRFALKEIGSGSVTDIATVLARCEPGLTLAEMVKKIGGTLSKLKGKHMLIAVRSGKKYHYTLPDEMTR